MIVVRLDHTDPTSLILPHADADEAPGKSLGVVSMVTWHEAVKSSFVE